MVKRLVDSIFVKGRVPATMLDIHIIPKDKPKKGQRLCSSKRPISLLSSLAKALEAVVYHRIAAKLERTLSPRQYAYRAARGTEMHLSGVYDFVRAHSSKGGYVYLAGLDISGAFDTAPHSRLLETMASAGADPYILRFLGEWLRERRFRARLATPKSRFASRSWPVTRGLPQGGVLSSFLWIVYFNSLRAEIREEQKRWAEDLREIATRMMLCWP